MHRTEHAPSYILSSSTSQWPLTPFNRAAPWAILAKLGCPKKSVLIIRLFRDMTGEVLSDGTTSDACDISDGVKQGCVLALVLFTLSIILLDLSAKTKTIQRIILEALFANDFVPMAHTGSDLQHIVAKFTDASQLFGLTICLGKTEVQHQLPPGTTAPAPSITIDETELKVVENFKCLGSTTSSDESLDREISARISKASQALGRLRTRVLNQHNIQMTTKLLVYRAVVLTALLYGCESWTLYKRHIKQLEAFYMCSLRSMLKIRWRVSRELILPALKQWS